MKIALLTLGTRGDVQPYAVLGKALKQRGHHVTLSTAKNFETLVRSYDIDFLPVNADFQAFMQTDEGKEMMKNPFRARKNLEKWVYPMIYDALKTFYNLAKGCDKVLYHVKTLGDYFADQFPEKMVRANVVPAFQMTNEFANPIFSGLHPPKFLNRLSYRISELSLKMMDKPIQKFRESEGLSKSICKMDLPSIYAISPYYLRKPADYPSNAYFTGFWTATSREDLDQALVDFIEAGEPPILITFGSMPFVSGIDLQATLLRLSLELQVRLIIVKGWGVYDTSAVSSNKSIITIDAAPYDKLLPFVKCVIHHGGIGTITACMQAGKPFFSCPVMYPFGDQYFWAKVAYQKGIAIEPIPLKKLTPEVLIEKTKELLHNKELYKKAQDICHQLKLEDGVKNAVEEIENF